MDRQPQNLKSSPHCVVVGGGVIGLSIAYELARRHVQCTIIDAPRATTQASWAAAGILPTPHTGIGADPSEPLRLLSHQMYAEWSRWLLEETGIDNGFRQCGGLHLARDPAEAAALVASMTELIVDGGRVERLSTAELKRCEPNLQLDRVNHDAIFRLPDEAQIRTPRHLTALRIACLQRGAQWITAHVTGVRSLDNGQVQISYANETIRSDFVCLAGGAWTGEFLRNLGVRTGIEPMRGQMVLWHLKSPLIDHVVNEGLRYLVSRPDGYLLAGATVDDSGFDHETRDQDLKDLVAFAESWLPALANVGIHTTWAGLRGGSRRGRPYLGRIPGQENILVAAGHFRSGVHLAPATAMAIANLLLHEPSPFDLTPFGIQT
ncbi:MAG: FAD-dependent oxidoreductase [Planctomycetota bacterium]|nr:FAD-dependent oxidoreductase [Planctomycetota bacterium]